jgi:hypothetical protein
MIIGFDLDITVPPVIPDPSAKITDEVAEYVLILELTQLAVLLLHEEEII